MRVNALLGSALLFSFVGRITHITATYHPFIACFGVECDTVIKPSAIPDRLKFEYTPFCAPAEPAPANVSPATPLDDLTRLWFQVLQKDVKSELVQEIVKLKPEIVNAKNEQGDTALEYFFKRCTDKTMTCTWKKKNQVQFSTEEISKIRELVRGGFANVSLSTITKLYIRIGYLEPLQQALEVASASHWRARETPRNFFLAHIDDYQNVADIKRMANLCKP
jgi:hypothetical protein